MIPTRRGLFFIGVGVVTYLLTQQSNVGWFYVADAFVWAVLLVNLALPRWTLWGLRVHRRLSADRGATTEGLFEGDTVRVTFQLTNPGRVPRYFFSVADHCPLEAPDSQQSTPWWATLRRGRRYRGVTPWSATNGANTSSGRCAWNARRRSACSERAVE